MELGVREVDDCVVGDDVLDRRRIHADLAHDSAERVFRERIDLEARRVPALDPTDVGLVYLRVDLHLGQVLRDREDGRRLQRRSDRLAHVDVARHDDAVDRRANHGMVEVGAGDRNGGVLLAHQRLGLRDTRRRGIPRRLRRFVVAGRDIELLLGDDAILRHRRGPVVIRLRLHQRRIGLREIRLGHDHAGPCRLEVRGGLQQRALQQRRVDQGDHFPPVHARVEVDVELGDRARHLGTDLHGNHGVDRSGGVDGVADLALLHLGRQILGRVPAAEREQHDETDEPAEHTDEEPPVVAPRDQVQWNRDPRHSYLSASTGSSNDALRAG